MKLFLYFISLFALFITSCSIKSNTHSNTLRTISQYNQSNEVVNIDSTVCIFDTSIHLDEEIAMRELSAAGILKCDTIIKDKEFEYAVIEFAGVKFALNRGFVFITSEQNKQTIDSLVSKISLYYGEPFIDDEGDPEYNYYHWNLYDPSSEKPYIRIRPLHSDEGGLVMTWMWN